MKFSSFLAMALWVLVGLSVNMAVVNAEDPSVKMDDSSSPEKTDPQETAKKHIHVNERMQQQQDPPIHVKEEPQEKSQLDELMEQLLEYWEWLVRLLKSRAFWTSAVRCAVWFAQLFFLAACFMGDSIWNVFMIQNPPAFWWTAKQGAIQIGIFLLLIAPHLVNRYAPQQQ